MTLGTYLVILACSFAVMAFWPLLSEEADKGNLAPLLYFTAASGVVFIFLPFLIGPKFIRVYAVPPQPFTGRAKTIAEVLTINRKQCPFEVVSDESYDLKLQYKIADATWSGVLFKGGFKETYSLYIRLDEAKKTAYFVERTNQVRWNIGVGSVAEASISWSAFVGINFFGFQREKIIDLPRLKTVADIKCDLSATRYPVFKILLANGWTMRAKLLPWSVRK